MLGLIVVISLTVSSQVLATRHPSTGLCFCELCVPWALCTVGPVYRGPCVPWALCTVGPVYRGPCVPVSYVHWTGGEPPAIMRPMRITLIRHAN
jgi:hypothetical protein